MVRSRRGNSSRSPQCTSLNASRGQREGRRPTSDVSPPVSIGVASKGATKEAQKISTYSRNPVSFLGTLTYARLQAIQYRKRRSCTTPPIYQRRSIPVDHNNRTSVRCASRHLLNERLLPHTVHVLVDTVKQVRKELLAASTQQKRPNAECRTSLDAKEDIAPAKSGSTLGAHGIRNCVYFHRGLVP